MNENTLSPSLFDEITAPARIIWTAESIARRIGTSADFVRDRLAKEPGSPVKMIGGRYCAVEADLMDYFRAKRDR